MLPNRLFDYFATGLGEESKVNLTHFQLSPFLVCCILVDIFTRIRGSELVGICQMRIAYLILHLENFSMDWLGRKLFMFTSVPVFDYQAFFTAVETMFIQVSMI